MNKFQWHSWFAWYPVDGRIDEFERLNRIFKDQETMLYRAMHRAGWLDSLEIKNAG